MAPWETAIIFLRSVLLLVLVNEHGSQMTTQAKKTKGGWGWIGKTPHQHTQAHSGQDVMLTSTSFHSASSPAAPLGSAGSGNATTHTHTHRGISSHSQHPHPPPGLQNFLSIPKITDLMAYLCPWREEVGACLHQNTDQSSSSSPNFEFVTALTRPDFRTPLLMRMWPHHNLCETTGLATYIQDWYIYEKAIHTGTDGIDRCRWETSSTERTVRPPCFLSDVALSWPVVVQAWGNFASVGCDDSTPRPVSASLQAVRSVQWPAATSDYRVLSLDTM